MGWNGSNSSAGEPRQHAEHKILPASYLWLLAGLLAIIVTGALFWLSVRSADGDRTPAVISKAQRAPIKVKRVSTPIPDTGDARLDARLHRMNAVDRTVEVEVAAAQAKPEVIFQNAHESARVFSTGVEQLMSLMFTCERGNFPFPLVPIDEEDMNNLATILISKNEFKDEDTDEIKYCKETVMAAKKEMISYIKQGGSPDEFMAYYHEILTRDFEYRSEAISTASETYAEDPDLAVKFVQSMNAKFAEDGIQPISLEDISGGEIKDDENN